MTLGEHIAQLRAARGLSQEDLADALGVSRQSVSKWETDASVPELEKLLRLSDCFGVTLDQLVTGEQSAASPESEPVPAAAPPSPPLWSRQRLAAIILLCMAFLMWLLLTALGGFLEGKMMKTRKFLWGSVCGLLYFTILAVISLAVNQSFSGGSSHFVTTLALCLAGGTLGGMVS